MIAKRKYQRTPRRVNVRFRKKAGDEKFAVGYTKNISPDGLFIGTIRPLPPGTEIIVEMKEEKRVRRRPAAVVHAARVSALLASVQSSGMGVRFLDLEGAGDTVSEIRGGDVGTMLETEERDERSTEAKAGSPDIEIDLSDVERFREAFRRDIQHGLIFVQGPIASKIGEEVLVRVLVPGGDRDVALRARVDRETICRSEAYGELGTAGFMLVIVDADAGVRLLRASL